MIHADIKKLGPDNPIPMKSLAKRYAISSRVVRDAINELRTVDHQPICGDNNGYYWPRYKQDWERTTARLGSMVKKLKDAIDGGNSYYENTDQKSLF